LVDVFCSNPYHELKLMIFSYCLNFEGLYKFVYNSIVIFVAKRRQDHSVMIDEKYRSETHTKRQATQHGCLAQLAAEQPRQNKNLL